jgi:2-dehydro-3-deoxygluconokinase
MNNVLSIGECMLQLREERKGKFTQSFGGDSLNTAIYLSRLGIETSYLTALGDDRWSDEMVAQWKKEGINTSLVRRVPHRMPGLYIIQNDTDGERNFSYWRDQAPAREIFERDEPSLAQSFLQHDRIYFTGITLSLYSAEGRTRLFDYLQRANDAGAWIIFDTNFRAAGWPDRREADRAFRQAIEMADVLFASYEDMTAIFDHAAEAMFNTAKSAEKILKLQDASARLVWRNRDEVVAPLPVKKIIDTTAAGDSFAAGYLAARIKGKSPLIAAAAGHQLANVVIQNPGAIIPRSKMPKSLMKLERVENVETP